MRDDYSHLVGWSFPGGSVNVPRWMNQLWAASVGSGDTAPFVHPVLVYVAAVEGSGSTFQDIFDLMDANADSGILFGEQQLDFAGPLEVERTYNVDGEITEVVRKSGKRAGVFDLLTFALRLREPGSAQPTAVSTTTFLFPRVESVG